MSSVESETMPKKPANPRPKPINAVKHTGRPPGIPDRAPRSSRVDATANRNRASPAPEPATIGDRILARRLAAGLTQRELAGILEPPGYQSTVGAVEKAGDNVPIEGVRRFAKALGCDPCDLDPGIMPAKALTLARAADPVKGVGWEPLRGADRAVMDEIWEGPGPDRDGLAKLADAAVDHGVAVVLRGDLPVKIDVKSGRKATTNRRKTPSATITHSHKGFSGIAKWDKETGQYFGQLKDITHIITFRGRTVEEVLDSMRDSVEVYVEWCRKNGEEPKQPQGEPQ